VVDADRLRHHSSVTTFAEVETHIAVLPEERHRGDAFERVVAHFLRHDPTLGMRRVWIWLDWPGRLSAGIRAVDLGIDLVAEDELGDLVGVQVVRAAAASSYFLGSVTRDTGPRIRLTSTVSGGGAIYFDDGTAAAGSEDTNLYRNGIGALKTDATMDTGGAFLFNGTQVVGSRKTGWTNATGTAARGTFVTSTVTLNGLAASQSI